MATQILPHTIVHPAWEAVEQRLTDPVRWQARAEGKPEGYHDWQIALAMCVAGYGDDLIITERDAEGQPKAYVFPDHQMIDSTTDAFEHLADRFADEPDSMAYRMASLGITTADLGIGRPESARLRMCLVPRPWRLEEDIATIARIAHITTDQVRKAAGL